MQVQGLSHMVAQIGRAPALFFSCHFLFDTFRTLPYGSSCRRNVAGDTTKGRALWQIGLIAKFDTHTTSQKVCKRMALASLVPSAAWK
jgi:hypothetical protein